ncbi:DUF3365 domain-containing protein [Gemmatimonadota bacterium]
MRARATIFAGASLLCACGGGLPEMTPEETQVVQELGEPAAGELARTLIQHLSLAMAEGGPSQAVDFCSSEALDLTEEVQAGLTEGFGLKRTSLNYRNPANMPDEFEDVALRYFQHAIGEGDQAPPSYIQRVSREEIRYYKPLFLGEPCLQCHGDPVGFDPGVREILAERYPADLATGYELGDFRGLIRVSVPAQLVEKRLRAEG